jgi:hypothetical protein
MLLISDLNFPTAPLVLVLIGLVSWCRRKLNAKHKTRALQTKREHTGNMFSNFMQVFQIQSSKVT